MTDNFIKIFTHLIEKLLKQPKVANAMKENKSFSTEPKYLLKDFAIQFLCAPVTCQFILGYCR